MHPTDGGRSGSGLPGTIEGEWRSRVGATVHQGGSRLRADLHSKILIQELVELNVSESAWLIVAH
jgi:hypothetical protein